MLTRDKFQGEFDRLVKLFNPRRICEGVAVDGHALTRATLCSVFTSDLTSSARVSAPRCEACALQQHGVRRREKAEAKRSILAGEDATTSKAQRELPGGVVGGHI